MDLELLWYIPPASTETTSRTQCPIKPAWYNIGLIYEIGMVYISSSWAQKQRGQDTIPQISHKLWEAKNTSKRLRHASCTSSSVSYTLKKRPLA